MIFTVLGCPRSGTSLVARILHEWGINMGRDFIQSDEGNPEGYYEDWQFVRLNKDILKAQGCSWSEPWEFNPTAVGEGHRNSMADLIFDRDIRFDRWGWKDPRTLITFPVWYTRMHTNTRFILVGRRREEIIMSIQKLYGLSRSHAVRLYEYYLSKRQEVFSQFSEQCYVIRYELLVDKQSCERSLQGLAEFCGINWAPAVKEFIRWKNQ